MRRFVVMFLALVACVLTRSPCAIGDSVFGEWEGTWYVDEKFNSAGGQYGSPPYLAEHFWLNVWPYDGTSLGYVAFQASFPNADIVELAVDSSNNVTMTLDYSPHSTIPQDPRYYAYITGVLAGNVMTGDFDECVPAPPGWFTFRGPYELKRVPEPGTLLMLAMGALAFTVGWWRRRRAAFPSSLSPRPTAMRTTTCSLYGVRTADSSRLASEREAKPSCTAVLLEAQGQQI